MFDFYRVDQILGTPETVWSFMGKLIPVGTFVLGIVVNRSLARSDKRRRDKKTVRDLVTEIELLETPVKKQLESVETFIADLRSDKNEVPKFNSPLQLKLDRLKGLDRTGVVDHLERSLGSRKEALEKANELFLGCEVLTFQYEQLQEIIETYVENGSRIHERWREEANALIKLAVDYMVEVEQQGKAIESDPLIGPTIELTHQSLLTHKDIFEAFEKMHKPLMLHLGAHRLDPRVRSLSEANAKASQSVMALQREREYAIGKLEQVKEKLAARFEKLKTHSQSLNSRG
ncbi:MAG: hypothetical protein ABI599_07805 [Flavobacteriales bacterium]